MSSLKTRLKRPLVLAMLVAIPFLYAPIAKFSDNHAFLINASPSLPNWAFWLDKNFAPAPSFSPAILAKSRRFLASGY